ncbi:hypothetical protein CGCSCA4_v011788 [Colletotrichum siamense]|uniref:GPI anchored protein n=1 Tax=Colletotrichum siamense TaxID=690259 RepID=A0A9P5BNN7_COLSI|nr:hypothetical protein CGCSCA4_v011788 [Colletotrichum siamense]KAF4843771.1 hypothetical protein CGCSCA2_v014135 [Colletotrichum siamense]
MMFLQQLVLLAAAVGLVSPVAAQSSTKTEKSTVWLPPRSTRAGENIYASVITAAPSSTEFLLACTSNFRSVASCSQFSGVTLTYGNSTMKIGFRSETFDCTRGSTARCSVGGANNAAAAETVLSSSESASWSTAITIIGGHDKLNSAKSKTSSTSTTPASAATSTANGVCKRATTGDVDGGTNSATKPKTNHNNGGDGCSGTNSNFAGLPTIMAGVALVVGVAVTICL